MYRKLRVLIGREVYVSEQFYSRYGEELGLSAWGRQMEILSDHVFSPCQIQRHHRDPACDGAELLRYVRCWIWMRRGRKTASDGAG